jgi:hypothetical protein
MDPLFSTNHFNLSNPTLFKNHKTGQINVQSMSMDSAKDVLPILQTNVMNEGAIIVKERFMLDNVIKFENSISACLTSSIVDIQKIEDLINNGSIIATNHLNLTNPKLVHNTKSGSIKTAQLNVVPQQEVSPIFKTDIQNDGKIYATEKLAIEHAHKLENNEDALIHSNDIIYEGHIVENTNGSIIGINSIEFDLHDNFTNKSTRTDSQKIQELQKTLLETQQLDVF